VAAICYRVICYRRTRCRSLFRSPYIALNLLSAYCWTVGKFSTLQLHSQCAISRTPVAYLLFILKTVSWKDYIFWCFQESEIRRSRPFWDVMQRLSHFMNGIHALTFIPRQIRSQSHSQCYRRGGANDDPGLYQRRVQDLQTGWPWGGYWQHPPTGQRLPSLRLIR